MTDEHIKLWVEEYLDEKGISNSMPIMALSTNDLVELAKRFVSVVEVNGRIFIGIDGWLQWLFACLLERWFNVAKNHEGEVWSELPELVSLNEKIETFKSFAKEYLGFEYKEGIFVELEERSAQ